MSTPEKPPSERPGPETVPTPSAAPVPPRPPAPTPSELAPGEDRPSTWQPMLWFKLIALLLIVAYAIAFVVKNTDEIPIDFVFGTTKVHLIWAMLLILAIGIFGGVLLSQLYRRRARRGLRQKGGKPGDARGNLSGRDEAVRKPR